MKYFYLIQRDNSIHEVDYSPEKYQKVCEEWARGGLFFVRSKNNETNKGINSVDVKNILSEDDYISWVESSKPALFVYGGVWRDSKERKIVRYEKWKQDEIDSIDKLGTGVNGLTDKESIEANKSIDKVRDMLKDKRILTFDK